MMSKVAFILAVVCLAFCGCKQRQHISKANIEVVQQALAEANSSDAHFTHFEKGAAKPKGDSFSMAKPSPSKASERNAVTAKEVESVLGPPHEVEPPETALRDVEIYRYYYYQDANRYEFDFHNGRLIAINLRTPGLPVTKS